MASSRALSTHPIHLLSCGQLSFAPWWEESLHLLHLIRAAYIGWVPPTMQWNELWNPRGSLTEKPLDFLHLLFPLQPSLNPLSLRLTRKGAFKVTRLMFAFDSGAPCLSPFSVHLSRLWDSGVVCSFPTQDSGLMVHVSRQRASSAVLKNERQASTVCLICNPSPGSSANASLWKEALTQITESHVWNKWSCNKHFRLQMSKLFKRLKEISAGMFH